MLKVKKNFTTEQAGKNTMNTGEREREGERTHIILKLFYCINFLPQSGTFSTFLSFPLNTHL